MTSSGHNGGPPLAFTAKVKLERIKHIVERHDLTSAQKCVGIGIVVSADKEWTAEVKTAQLMTMASVKDKETVFKATKKLEKEQLIEKAHSKGQSGRYNVLPPKIIEAVMEAFEELQSSRVKPDGASDPVPISNPSGFDRPTPTEPVGFNRPSPMQSAQPSQAPMRAQFESLRDSYPLESEVKNPLGSPTASADDLARQAYLDGLRTKQGVATKSARAAQRVKGELDGSRGIEFSDGKLTVMNGAAAKLSADFPGIDLEAVCDRAGPEITKMNYPTADDAMSVLRKWARIVMEEMGKRVGSAVRGKPKESELQRMERLMTGGQPQQGRLIT